MLLKKNIDITVELVKISGKEECNEFLSVEKWLTTNREKRNYFSMLKYNKILKDLLFL